MVSLWFVTCWVWAVHGYCNQHFVIMRRGVLGHINGGKQQCLFHDGIEASLQYGRWAASSAAFTSGFFFSLTSAYPAWAESHLRLATGWYPADCRLQEPHCSLWSPSLQPADLHSYPSMLCFSFFFWLFSQRGWGEGWRYRTGFETNKSVF